MNNGEKYIVRRGPIAYVVADPNGSSTVAKALVVARREVERDRRHALAMLRVAELEACALVKLTEEGRQTGSAAIRMQCKLS